MNRKTAYATLTATLAAEAPDIDVLWNLQSSLAGFEHHRGITHTFVGVPVMAALTLGVVWLWHRWRARRGKPPQQPVRWGWLYLFACIAALSHILLDFTNIYGVRPLEPFAWRWYEWDIVSIIEPVMLAILALGLLLPRLFRLINEEIGSRDVSRGRGAAITALVLIALFWGFRDAQHRRAVAALEARVYEGAEPVRVSAFPYDTDPFVWYGLVETRDFYAMMQVDSRTGEVDPEGRMRIRYKHEETPVTLAAQRSRMGQVYLDWAAYPVLEVEKLQPPDAGYLVTFYDLRFTYPGTTRRPLRARVQLDEQLNVVAQGMGDRMQPLD